MIVIFDLGYFIIAVLMVILGLFGIVEKAMPVLSVLTWIVFAISAIGLSVMALGQEDNVGRRIVNLIVNVIAHVLIGIVLADLLHSLKTTSGFDFIGTILIGGFVMYFGAGFLLFAVGRLINFDYESTLPYGVRLTLTLALLIAAGVFAIKLFL